MRGGLRTCYFCYPEIFQCEISLMSRPTDLNGKFKTAWCHSWSPRLLHQDVTKGCGVPVAIIWSAVGHVSSAGVSAAPEPDVGVDWVAVILLVGEDADSDLEVTHGVSIETLPVAVLLQGAALQQTLPLMASQRCSMVFTISDQGMERIGRDVNRFERPVASVVHSKAHFCEGSGPVSSLFRLLVVKAIYPCFCVKCVLVCPIWWIPPEGVLKLIVRISKLSAYSEKVSISVPKVANPTIRRPNPHIISVIRLMIPISHLPFSHQASWPVCIPHHSRWYQRGRRTRKLPQHPHQSYRLRFPCERNFSETGWSVSRCTSHQE